MNISALLREHTHHVRRGVMLCAAMSLVGVAACGAKEEPTTNYDPELLESYRAAIPSEEVMQAATPDGSGTSEGGLTQALVGDPAIYPQSARPVAEGVNKTIKDIVRTMKAIVAIPPTFYDAESKEFLWGPWPNDDGVGFAAAYIKDNGPNAEDFRYVYALIRLPTNKLEDGGTPVIWGGSNPDPDNEDFGAGVTLWDFEANFAFEEANNPEHGALPRGRFAAVYARQMDGDARATWVVSAFRGFVTEEEPDAAPANLDYFHGEYMDRDNAIRWLNYQGLIDVTDGDDDPDNDAPSAPELLDVRMVFAKDGHGRAEAFATGGDVGASENIDALLVAECWNTRAAQTWVGYSALDSGGETLWSAQDGEVSDCGPIFENELSTIDLPTLDDVDPELRAGLGEIAENGVQ